MRLVDIRLADGVLVCNAEVAEGFLTRARGLLGRKSLPVDAGLLIQPCTSVHTFFMRFTIDVLYLDRNDRVVKAVTLKPFRLSMGGKGTKRTLEMAQGSIARASIQRGVQLQITQPEGVSAS